MGPQKRTLQTVVVMLGWHISVYRISEPISSNSSIKVGERVAVWQAGLSGLNWIDDLVQKGEAVSKGGNGYPTLYLILKRHLEVVLKEGPPSVHDVWHIGPLDIIGPDYEGKTVISEEVLNKCASDEWLLVEAWDES